MHDVGLTNGGKVTNESSESVSAPTRARDLGLSFDGVPGTTNTITDVPGLSIGMTTVHHGDHVRTGVTAILPLGRDRVGVAVPAGLYAHNGNGELTGAHWIEESGSLSGFNRWKQHLLVAVIVGARRMPPLVSSIQEPFSVWY